MTLDFAGLSADLLQHSRQLLPEWFPAGKFRGHEFVMGDVHGAEGESCSVNTNTGQWADFAAGTKGGDLISLYAAANRIDQGAAFKALSNGSGIQRLAPVPKRAPTPKRAAFEPIPVPGDAPSPPDRWGKAIGEGKYEYPRLSHRWTYYNAAGEVMGYTCRFDSATGKDIVPQVWTREEATGKEQWRWRHMAKPRPIYNLRELLARPDAPVIIVEGEKCADAIAKLAPQYVGIAWAGGAQAWATTDWKPLAGRQVLLWPDNDRQTKPDGTMKPMLDQPGLSCMWGLAHALVNMCKSVKLIIPDDEGLPDGWDAADAVADGWKWEVFKSWALVRVLKIDKETSSERIKFKWERGNPNKHRGSEGIPDGSNGQNARSPDGGGETSGPDGGEREVGRQDEAQQHSDVETHPMGTPHAADGHRDHEGGDGGAGGHDELPMDGIAGGDASGSRSEDADRRPEGFAGRGSTAGGSTGGGDAAGAAAQAGVGAGGDRGGLGGGPGGEVRRQTAARDSDSLGGAADARGGDSVQSGVLRQAIHPGGIQGTGPTGNANDSKHDNGGGVCDAAIVQGSVSGSVPHSPQSIIGRWLAWDLERYGNAPPVANLNNAVTVLNRDPALRGVAVYDQFLGKVLTLDAESNSWRDWRDVDDIRIQLYMQRTVGLSKMTASTVRDAICMVSQQEPQDSARDWLERLVWDGRERVEQFMQTVFGAVDSSYVRAVSRNFWISMVARQFRPGCQVDNMVVLEGRQGTRKSTACEIIGGAWYAEQHESASNPRAFAEILAGKLIVEISELGSFSKAETNHIKRAVTVRSDRYRAPYGRTAEDHARRNILIGTTNKDDWNRDDTGARRFWPIKCTQVADVTWLKTYREQLFAEAVAMFKDGHAWHIVPAEDAEREQMERYESDPWRDTIGEWIVGREWTYVTEVAFECLKIVPQDMDMTRARRIGSVLRELGLAPSGTKRVGNKTVKCFIKVTDENYSRMEAEYVGEC